MESENASLEKKKNLSSTNYFGVPVGFPRFSFLAQAKVCCRGRTLKSSLLTRNFRNSSTRMMENLRMCRSKRGSWAIDFAARGNLLTLRAFPVSCGHICLLSPSRKAHEPAANCEGSKAFIPNACLTQSHNSSNYMTLTHRTV